jgi:hypothetical protein
MSSQQGWERQEAAYPTFEICALTHIQTHTKEKTIFNSE